MPFYTPEPQDQGFRAPMGRDPGPRVDPSTVADAAFNQGNSVVSAIRAVRNSGAFEPDPTHNPLDVIKNTPYEEQYLDRFAGSHSEAETRSIMSKIDGEERDRRILQAAGPAGTVAELLAGSLDPIFYLPTARAMQAGKTAAGFGRQALRGGVSWGAQVAAQEAALQATQTTRAPGDSAMAIGSAALLGALIGPGAASIFSRDEHAAMSGQLNHQRTRMDNHVAGVETPEGFDAHFAATTPDPPTAPQGATPAPLAGLDAFHGSPHDFDAFDISRIGTGEGAQSYGHGLYFAEKPEVAESYKAAGVNKTATSAAETLAVANLARGRSAADLRKLAETERALGETGETYEQAAHLIETGAVKPPNLYRVRILADKDHMLDWDKPLSEQSEFVKERLAELKTDEQFRSEYGEPKSGGDFYKALGVTSTEAGYHTDKAAGTQILRQAGIPGIKYLDEGSRGPQIEPIIAEAKDSVRTWEAHVAAADNSNLAYRQDMLAKAKATLNKYEETAKEPDKQTHNFVVFDDKLIAITHKNGEPILKPTPAPMEPTPAPSGVSAAAGAAATDTRKLEPVPAYGLEKLAVDLGQRAFNRPFLSARRAMADLLETPTEVKENLTGGTTTLGGGPSLETMGRVQRHQTRVAISDELTRQWVDLKFNGEKAPMFAKTRAWAGVMDKNPEMPTFEEFKSHVSDAMMNEDKHDIPQVQSAAQFVRKKLFDVWGPRAEAAIEGFKLADQVMGESHFPHSWDKPKIKANRPGFVNHLTSKYVADQEAKAAAKERISGLQRDLEAAQGKVAKAKDENARVAAQAEHDALRTRIEGEIAAWHGKSSAEAKAAMKAREKYRSEAEAAGKTPGEKGRLTSADSTIDSAVKHIMESHRDLSVEDLRGKAQETTDRILGSPDGRLPYDEFAGSLDAGPRPPGMAARGSLAERSLNVSNAFARDWIERDVEKVAETYMRTFMPDVLLAEKFGDVEMSETFHKINDEHAALSDATKNKKESLALEKQKDGAIEDMAAARDLFRGLYNIPQTAAARRMGRISSAIRNANVPLSLGASAVSSLPDAGGALMRWGMMNTFRDAWVPFVKSVMTNRDLVKEAMRQFRVMGIAVDTELASRHHQLSGITATSEAGSPLERTLQWGADKTQIASGLGPWTDVVKSISSTVAATGFLRAAEARVKGTATQHQLRSLGAANITADMAERIAKQYRESGTLIDNTLLPNTEAWTDKAARDVFEGALSRDANIMVVTPGLAGPLFIHDPIAAMLFQFKSYTAAAHTRILIANLQRSDANTLSGLVGMLGLGMLSYKINSMTGGQPTSDNPGDWIKEAMSRGNVFGWFEEANAMASKLSGGKADVYRMTGSGKELSRYAGRNMLDQILGPTAGKIQRLGQVTSAAGRQDWNATDTHALRQLLFLQNAPYLRGLFNEVEAGANNAFGIPAKQQKQ